jgi:hypothetical protein
VQTDSPGCEDWAVHVALLYTKQTISSLTVLCCTAPHSLHSSLKQTKFELSRVKVNLSLCLIKHHDMRACRGVEMYPHNC